MNVPSEGSLGNTSDLDALEDTIYQESLTADGSAMSTNKVEDQTSLVVNNNEKKSKKDKHSFRPLARRSSVENIAWLGLMSPALTVVPTIDGFDSLTQTFADLHGENRELKLAAAHIDDALHGRGKYGRARAIFKSKIAQLCFKTIDNIWFQRFVLIFVVIHSGLIFWEPPSNSLEVPIPVLVLTPICLLVYTIDVILHIIFYTWPVFWSLSENKWMRVQFMFVCMYTIDFIILIVQALLPSTRLFQVFRAFRTAMLLCKLKNVAHIQDVLMSIIQKLAKVFMVILIFILLFAAFGVHSFIFEYSDKMKCGRVDEDCSASDLRIYNGTFDNIAIAGLRLIVLLSTDNYPDLMFPAYYTTPWYSLYFVIFEFLGVFLITAILLAIIVDSYWVFSKRHVKEERKRERVEFAKAWNLLDPLGELSLNIHQDKFIQLFRLLKPQNTDKINWKLIESLDDDDDSIISYTEWTTRLYDTLNVELTDHSKIKKFVKIPNWLKNISSKVQKFVRNPWFVWFIFGLLVFHTILFCLKWKDMSDDADLGIQILKTIIVSIFVVEMLLRILGEGHNLLNRTDIIDLLLVSVAAASNIVWYVTPEWRARGTNISCLAVAFRIAFVNQTKNIKYAEVLLKVIPIMYDLLLLIIAIIYFVSVVGFEAFFGFEPSATSVLPEASVVDYDCGIGFNKFSCSLLVIFQLILGIWADTLNIAIESTKSVWVCIYFVSCYVILVLAVMNLFIAIAYRAFQHATEREETISGQNAQQPNQPESPSRPVSGVRENLDLNSSIVDLEKNEPKEEKEDENLAGLSAKERKEKLTKKRLAEKKKGKQQHKKLEEFEVITAFKGLELRHGDKVKILQKDGDIWEGLINGKQGWFPAYCVSEEDEMTSTITSQGTGQKKNSLPGQNELDVPWRRGILGDMTVLNPEELREINKVVKSDRRNSQSLRRSSSENTKKAPKIARRESGAEIPWRRGILGDMTVLNPEELKEINNIVKSGRRGSLSKATGLGNYGLSKSLPMPDVEETSEASKQDNGKPSDGAMPSWALSFLGKNQLNATQDVKINDETILEEEEESEQGSEGTGTQTTEV